MVTPETKGMDLGALEPSTLSARRRRSGVTADCRCVAFPTHCDSVCRSDWALRERAWWGVARGRRLSRVAPLRMRLLPLSDRCSRTDNRPHPGHARPTPGPNDLFKPKTTAYQFGSSKDVGAQVTRRPRPKETVRGFVFVGVNTAANAGVPADKAGLAAALINTSTWVGGALGLAIFSVIATTRTTHLLAHGATPPAALTGGFHRALIACVIYIAAAALIALRATNTRGEKQPAIEADPALEVV